MVLRHFPDKKKYRFVLYSNRPVHPDFQALLREPHLQWVTGEGFFARWGGAWFNASLPFLLKKAPPPLFWGAQQVLPPFLPRGTKAVLTYYDLVLYFYPEAMRVLARIQQRIFQRYSVKRADAILSISSRTMHDMIRKFNYPKERAKVALLGCEEKKGAKGGANRLPLPEPFVRDGYLLAVSTLEPRKNYGTLLAAYSRYLATAKRPLPLVIAGKRGWETPDFFDTLDQLVKRTGMVHTVENGDDETLAVLYRKCAFFVMSSVYEGFGLPLLEALFRGKYAVVSDIDPFHEIGGDAIRYVAANDTQGWVRALVETTALYRAGRLPGIRFNKKGWGWERTARIHYEAFEELC